VTTDPENISRGHVTLILNPLPNPNPNPSPNSSDPIHYAATVDTGWVFNLGHIFWGQW